MEIKHIPDLDRYFKDLINSRTPAEWEENDRLVDEYEKKCLSDAVEKNFLSCGASKNYMKKASFENYCIIDSDRETTMAQTLLKNIGLEYCTKIEKDEYQNLIICGNPGIGKTFLSLCIARKVCGMQKDYSCYPAEWNIRELRTCIYRTSDMLNEEMRCAQSFNAKINKYKLIERYVDADLLIIDEIGRTDLKNEKNNLFAVIDARHNELKPTIFISNWTEMKLKQELGEALASRIFQESFRPAEFILNKLPNMRDERIKRMVS